MAKAVAKFLENNLVRCDETTDNTQHSDIIQLCMEFAQGEFIPCQNKCGTYISKHNSEKGIQYQDYLGDVFRCDCCPISCNECACFDLHNCYVCGIIKCNGSHYYSCGGQCGIIYCPECERDSNIVVCVNCDNGYCEMCQERRIKVCINGHNHCINCV